MHYQVCDCSIAPITDALRREIKHRRRVIRRDVDDRPGVALRWIYSSIPTTTCRATFAVRCLQSFRIQAAEPLHVTISSLCPKLFGAERRAVMTWKISVSSVGHCNQTQLSHIFRLDGDATQAPLPDTAVKV